MKRHTLALAAVMALAGGCAPPGPAPPARPLRSLADAPVSAGPNAPAPTAPSVQAVRVAASFVRAWARPDLPQQAWFAGVRELVTEEYARLLADTDPRNVPARTVTGAPMVRTSTTQMLLADVPTDAGVVQVTVIPEKGRWRVATATAVGAGAR